MVPDELRVVVLVELRSVMLIECYTKRCSQLPKLHSTEDRWRVYEYRELIKL